VQSRDIGLPHNEAGTYYEAGTLKKAAESILCAYRSSAASRGLEWGLTSDGFFQLLSSPCHYSGIPPSNRKETKEGPFYWNGIDRVDSSKGYIPDNVVPCSSIANTAKMARPYDEFIEWLDQVAKFRTEQKALQKLFEE
jgi:hypothetical protein